jgi:hypothetical protein
MIMRRRVMLSALSLAVLGAGVTVVRRLPFVREDLAHLGPYSVLLQSLLDKGAMSPQVAAIGREYLAREPEHRDVHSLLRELAPLDRHQVEDHAPDVLAQRLRADIHAGVRNDLANGAMLVLGGYFVPTTLAKLCAVASLALDPPD